MALTPDENPAASGQSTLHTNRFSFQTVMNDIAGHQAVYEMEVLIREPFTHVKAGDVFVDDPDKQWETIDENEIVRTHPMEWALARLLFLFRQSNPQMDLAKILQIDGREARLTFIVRDQSGRLISQLALTGKKDTVFWQGPSKSFLLGKNACEELEALMFERPELLAEYQIPVPWRKSFGWNGKRFLSQRIVPRPEFYSPEKIASRQALRVASNYPRVIKQSFRIREHALVNNSLEFNVSKRPNRYTDVWPRPETCVNIPNWNHAYDEEGRSDQDETTIKPSHIQTYISKDVDYTAAEAFLADEQVVPAILCLSSQRVTGIVCFFETIFWEFDCGSFDDSEITPDQRSKFPIRVVSRLSKNPRDFSQTIRVTINELGHVQHIDAAPDIEN